MAAGWSCPKCELVLAPNVTEHRCDPAAEGATTVARPPLPPGWQPFTPTTTIATTGHLGVAGGYLDAVPDTDGMHPARLITEVA